MSVRHTVQLVLLNSVSLALLWWLAVLVSAVVITLSQCAIIAIILAFAFVASGGC